jgi:hypothetical protein
MIMKLRLRTALLGVAAALAAIAVSADPAPSGETTSTGKSTIGLVLTTWRPALRETPGGKEECPAGFQYLNRENLAKQFPTPEARAEFERQYIHLGPNSASGDILNPELYLQNRGPGGVQVGFNPTAVEDTLPLREVQSKVSFGLNLDGTKDGNTTPKTCGHEKFTSPEGEQGIDNQLYRLIGCSQGWRKGGFNVEYHGPQFRDSPLNRVLIEISDVDDERNDDHVVVTVYKGIDNIILDAAGKPIPWLPQRIDVRFPNYMSRTTGKIVNGVLYTDPVDQHFGLEQMNHTAERYIRDMRLRLNLGETTAEGLIAGYEDLTVWWNAYSKSYTDVVDAIGLWSPPSFYAAAHRLADGYPDPKTGQCTAISAAYHVDAVRVFVVKPQKNDPLVIDANLKNAQRLTVSR